MTARIESMQGEKIDTEALLKKSKNAFYKISTLNEEIRNKALETFARLTEESGAFLLAENVKDLEASEGKIKNSLYKRLQLDPGKLAQVVAGIRDVAALPDPIGQVLEHTTLDTGLELEKVSVPLGVIAMVFESRPDVIPQILSLALKSGNTVVLKGGREALNSNHAIHVNCCEVGRADSGTAVRVGPVGRYEGRFSGTAVLSGMGRPGYSAWLE